MFATCLNCLAEASSGLKKKVLQFVRFIQARRLERAKREAKQAKNALALIKAYECQEPDKPKPALWQVIRSNLRIVRIGFSLLRIGVKTIFGKLPGYFKWISLLLLLVDGLFNANDEIVLN